MAAPKLSPEQQNTIIEMLAARELYSAIANAVGCTITNIDYYAKKYSQQISRAREEYDARFIDRGLRSREKRMEELEWLYSEHKKELEVSGLHYTEVKVSAKGDRIEYDVYNQGLINQMRGIIKDIAEESNGRILRVAPTTPDGKEAYDGGSALNKLESSISRLAARVAAPESSTEPDGSGS